MHKVWLFFFLYCSLGFLTFNSSGDSFSLVPSGLFQPYFSTAKIEICDNAMDDDNDGLIDLNDPDCTCKIIEPISLIPNPSFEDRECCPSNRSQLNCASSWIQASEPTTDFIHSCGWFGWDEFPPPVPFPDGIGIMGFRDGRVNNNNPQRNWKEYAGACLLSPLLKDSTYLFEFHVGFVNNNVSPPINITFFGTNNCQNLPFGVGNETLGCPTNGPNWVRLGSRMVSGNNQNTWVKTTIEVKPDQDIYAIAIGPDCPGVTSSVSLYYFFDNLILSDIRSFQFKIEEEQHACSDNFKLKVPTVGSFIYQWYKNGIAILGENAAMLSKIYGEGDYQVKVEDGGSCKVTSVYTYAKPVITTSPTKIICYDDAYTFGSLLLTEPGVYQDTFKSIHHCDSIVTLQLKVLGELFDTVSAKIFEGDTYKIDNNTFSAEGNYEVQLKSSIGCDSLVLLQLNHIKLYYPNIFSPNGDGINEVFTLVNLDPAIKDWTFSIYDKWGSKIYEGTEWDGQHKGVTASQGIYTFTASLISEQNTTKQLLGSVTLIR